MQSKNSVPYNEDSLCFEVVFCFDDVLGKVFSIVRNLSPHVVNHEGFGEVVLIVWERHRLEVKSHHGSTLHIAELESTGRSVHINVEKLGYWGSVLGEVGVVETFLPFLVVINDVVGLWWE